MAIEIIHIHSGNLEMSVCNMQQGSNVTFYDIFSNIK